MPKDLLKISWVTCLFLWPSVDVIPTESFQNHEFVPSGPLHFHIDNLHTTLKETRLTDAILQNSIIFSMDNQQGPFVEHRELCSMLCGSLDRRRVRGRMDTCVCMAESLYYLPETLTALLISYTSIQASQVALVVKNLPANAGDKRDLGSIPGLGRCHGEGHDNPLQYSCLENPMHRGDWRASVHRVIKSQTQLKWLSTAHTHTPIKNKKL